MALSLAIIDNKIWSKDLLLEYLYTQFLKQEPSEIDFLPEATCLTSAGVYSIIDKFCNITGYNKKNITIKTANMIETHKEYNIIKHAGSWYEIPIIQKWLTENQINSQINPTKHFANFVGRTHWSRLWLATILNKYYRDITIQTYNYDGTSDNYNPTKYVGLDDLAKKGCNLLIEAAEFITTCPQKLNVEIYPIQHPTNLNLLPYYNNIFVDIVVETNVTGSSFLVTEKLWRPIIANRPFIVMSNRHYLSNLRKLGFQTFDTVWSEEYDNFTGADRIKQIQGLLAQISHWTIDELEIKLFGMKEILDHNKNIFKKLTISKIDEVFNA
jgi:hypothetical protein